MLTVSRQGVFETNSSSCHSIVIKRGSASAARLLEFQADNFYGLNIDTGKYGTVPKYIDAPLDKLSYLWTCVLAEEDRGGLTSKEVDEWAKYLDDELNMGRRDIFFAEDIGDGYVDHSEDEADFLKQVRNNPNMLKDYVFGESHVEIGNDRFEDEMPWPYNLDFDEIEEIKEDNPDIKLF